MTNNERLPKLPPRGGSAKAVIVLGVVLCSCAVAFTELWPAHVEPGKPASLRPMLALGAASILTLIGAWAWSVRKYFRFVREDTAAHAALKQGDFARAKETFWRWSESEIPQVAALSRHNLAWTLLRQGELEQAIAVAYTVLALARYTRELEKTRTWPTTMVDYALLKALTGKLDAAKKSLQQLEQRKGLATNATFPAMKAFTQAVIACRDGRAAEGARMLEEKWPEYESILTGDLLRPLRVVRAFAIASADAREAGKADLQLVNARPAFRGEYDFLGKAWPEMQAFLVTHELATSSVHPS